MIIEKCDISQLEKVKKALNNMWPSKSYEEVRQALQSDREVTFAAKIDSEIVGFIYGILRDDYMEGISVYPALYIEGVFVEEKYRKQNIASLLVDKLIEYGKTRDIKQVASECRETNIESYNWHMKNNFDIAGKIIHFVKNIDSEK